LIDHQGSKAPLCLVLLYLWIIQAAGCLKLSTLIQFKRKKLRNCRLSLPQEKFWQKLKIPLGRIFSREINQEIL
jgi:hypothetical protein